MGDAIPLSTRDIDTCIIQSMGCIWESTSTPKCGSAFARVADKPHSMMPLFQCEACDQHAEPLFYVFNAVV